MFSGKWMPFWSRSGVLVNGRFQTRGRKGEDIFITQQQVGFYACMR